MQAALPFESKPKDVKGRKKTDGYLRQRAVVMEPHEKKQHFLLQVRRHTANTTIRLTLLMYDSSGLPFVLRVLPLNGYLYSLSALHHFSGLSIGHSYHTTFPPLTFFFVFLDPQALSTLRNVKKAKADARRTERLAEVAKKKAKEAEVFGEQQKEEKKRKYRDMGKQQASRGRKRSRGGGR